MILCCLFIITTDSSGEEGRFEMIQDFTSLIIIAEVDGLLADPRIGELFEEIKAVHPEDLIKFANGTYERNDEDFTPVQKNVIVWFQQAFHYSYVATKWCTYFILPAFYAIINIYI